MKHRKITCLSLLKISLLLSVPAWSKFDKTSTGVQEDVSKTGGLSKDEESKLNSDVQKQIQQFKKGRTSSGVGGGGRFSSSLEMHDDYTGVTYHPGASSGLEKPMDDVATKNKNSSEEERQKALEKNRGEVGRCKDGKIIGSKNKDFPLGVECKNLSPVLIDMGPAHPSGENPELEKHRIYQLSDDAKKAAEKAGEQYSKQVLRDATNPEISDDSLKELKSVGASATVKMNRMGEVQNFSRTSDGKTNVSNVAPEVDLLRSEYSWLEQQKIDYTERAWKTLRAARLAGIPTEDQNEPGVREDMVEFISLVSNDPKADDKIAERIQERNTLSTEKFCLNSNNEFIVVNDQNRANCVYDKSTDTETPGSDGLTTKQRNLKTSLERLAQANQKSIPPETLIALAKNPSIDLKEAKALLSNDGTKNLYDQARANLGNLSAEEKKERAKSIDKIKNCLKENVWCSPSEVNIDGNKIADAYEDTSGKLDAANYVNDVREFFYTRYAGALRGPLSEMKKQMTFMDFNSTNTQRVGSKIYSDFEKEWKKAMEAAETVQKTNEQTERNSLAYGANGVKKLNYKNEFKKNKFDPTKQNTLQLFGRDESRDATTLTGTGKGNFGGRGKTPNPIRKPSNQSQQNSNTSPSPSVSTPAKPTISGTDLPAL